MSLRIFWAAFFAAVIVLVVLVVGLNCLQTAVPLRLFGVLECSYGLTSSDFRVKVGATTAFVLFLVLVFSPIVAALGQPSLTRRSKGSA